MNVCLVNYIFFIFKLSVLTSSRVLTILCDVNTDAYMKVFVIWRNARSNSGTFVFTNDTVRGVWPFHHELNNAAENTMDVALVFTLVLVRFYLLPLLRPSLC